MQPNLFELQKKTLAPLAYRMRPTSLNEVIGQDHLIGHGKFLSEIIRTQKIPSLIFWGPPGSGKTTLAHLLADPQITLFVALSAVSSGLKDVKEATEKARKELQYYGKRTLLFIDEIHRFNKVQQDALLPSVEDGTLILLGATTENPSFEVIAPLLSRLKVVVLNRLTEDQLKTMVERAIKDKEHGLGTLSLQMDESAVDFLCTVSGGDARRALNTLEIAAGLVHSRKEGSNVKKNVITLLDIELALQEKSLHYDKGGEEHYNTTSAFIKSMRDSDPDAAVYYLARMLEAGESPLFVARRMVIFASEDIGNADPQAIQVAISCMQAFDFVGMPEGWIPLAQSATYLASAPKSNASYRAYLAARADVREHGAIPTPLHLRNAPTTLMKNLGYGKGYLYAHDRPDHIAVQQHLPNQLLGKRYYEPTDNGFELNIKKWLQRIREKDK